MRDHVSASIRYTVNTGEKPVSLSRTLGGRIEYRNCTFAEHTVKIHNGRNEVDAFVFDQHGFVFVDHARFTAHSSFNDPQTPDAAPPRESIELRALVFFS